MSTRKEVLKKKLSHHLSLADTHRGFAAQYGRLAKETEAELKAIEAKEAEEEEERKQINVGDVVFHRGVPRRPRLVAFDPSASDPVLVINLSNGHVSSSYKSIEQLRSRTQPYVKVPTE